MDVFSLHFAHGSKPFLGREITILSFQTTIIISVEAGKND
jgi:hypothetical protein